MTQKIGSLFRPSISEYLVVASHLRTCSRLFESLVRRVLRDQHQTRLQNRLEGRSACVETRSEAVSCPALSYLALLLRWSQFPSKNISCLTLVRPSSR